MDDIKRNDLQLHGIQTGYLLTFRCSLHNILLVKQAEWSFI